MSKVLVIPQTVVKAVFSQLLQSIDKEEMVIDTLIKKEVIRQQVKNAEKQMFNISTQIDV